MALSECLLETEDQEIVSFPFLAATADVPQSRRLCSRSERVPLGQEMLQSQMKRKEASRDSPQFQCSMLECFTGENVPRLNGICLTLGDGLGKW